MQHGVPLGLVDCPFAYADTYAYAVLLFALLLRAEHLGHMQGLFLNTTRFTPKPSCACSAATVLAWRCMGPCEAHAPAVVLLTRTSDHRCWAVYVAVIDGKPVCWASCGCVQLLTHGYAAVPLTSICCVPGIAQCTCSCRALLLAALPLASCGCCGSCQCPSTCMAAARRLRTSSGETA